MSRWNSWGATSPLWVPGLLLTALGVALVVIAVKQVRRG